jgi:hypothetical protein
MSYDSTEDVVVTACERCGKQRAYFRDDVERGRATKYCQTCALAIYNETRPKRSEETKAQYKAAHYQKNKAQFDAYAKNWRRKERLALIDQFGGMCCKCGEADPVVLDFDHVNNDGCKDHKRNVIHRVRANPSRFQLLCKNCNWRKEYYRRNGNDAEQVEEAGSFDGGGESRSTVRQENRCADERGTRVQPSRQREFDFEAGDARSLHEEVQAQLDQ